VWQPYLDPTLEYCASITSFGFGDLARLPVVSNTVCARVDQVSLPGAEADVTVDGGADANIVVTPDAGTDAASAQAGDAAPPREVDASIERPRAVGDGPPSCSVTGGAGRPGPSGLVLVAAALLLRRRRRA
jgi:MYXO-CTERM domain-containing protein